MDTKKSAITKKGYIYQDYQALKIICKWLKNPEMYHSIILESEDKTHPQGLEDIIIKRKDGKTDYIQVKDTPNTENNLFDWDYLLCINNNSSRSLLKKLYDAYDNIEKKDDIGNIELITCKKPSQDIYEIIHNHKISFIDIPEEILTRIKKEFSNLKNLESFLNILNIKHSEKELYLLKSEVINDLREYTSNEHGIKSLIESVSEWSMYKKDENEIFLVDILEILNDKSIISSLSQDFYLTDNYIIPKKLHLNILNLLKEKNFIVLTGKAGSGKSSYLSFLKQDILDNNGIQSIRHHYFLSTQENNNRFQKTIVEDSLKIQIKELNILDKNENDDNLCSLINKCGDYYKKNSNSYLLLIIDGLDHVYRDNNNDNTPLEKFIDSIIPYLNDNVKVIIGTQKVSEKLIPNSIINKLPINEWVEHEKVDINFISEYFSKLNIEFDNNLTLEKIQHITKGNILYLFYLTKILKKNINLEYLQNFNFPESEDISLYYKKIWDSLSFIEKDILFCFCSYNFYWKKNFFKNIIKNYNDNCFLTIEHLLEEKISGFKIFHESFYQYIIKKMEQPKKTDINSKIQNWLNKDFNNHYIKNIWLPIINSNDDKFSRDPFKFINKNFLINSLSKGYNIKDLEFLLDNAEKYYFNKLNISKLIFIRHLKMRLLNGINFELNQNYLLLINSYLSNTDNTIIENNLSNLEILSLFELSILCLVVHKNGIYDSKKIFLKIKNKIKHIKHTELSGNLIELLSILFLNLNAVDMYSELKKETQGYINNFEINVLIKNKNFEFLINNYKNIYDTKIINNIEYKIFNYFYLNNINQNFIDNHFLNNIHIKIIKPLNSNYININKIDDEILFISNKISYIINTFIEKNNTNDIFEHMLEEISLFFEYFNTGYYENNENIKQQLINIAIHTHILLNKNKINFFKSIFERTNIILSLVQNVNFEQSFFEENFLKSIIKKSISIKQKEICTATEYNDFYNLIISKADIDFLNNIQFLNLVWRITLSYSSYKDLLFYSIARSLESIYSEKPIIVKKLISDLNPVINNINDFTEGETDIALEIINNLKKQPKQLLIENNYEINDFNMDLNDFNMDLNDFKTIIYKHESEYGLLENEDYIYTKWFNYQYNISEDKENFLLNLINIFKKDNHNNIILDLLYQKYKLIYKKNQQKHFKIFIEVFNLTNSWNVFICNESESIKRIDIAVKSYFSRKDEFLKQTMSRNDIKLKYITIDRYRFFYYYMKLKNNKNINNNDKTMYIKLIKNFINSIVDDTNHIPLNKK